MISWTNLSNDYVLLIFRRKIHIDLYEISTNNPNNLVSILFSYSERLTTKQNIVTPTNVFYMYTYQLSAKSATRV